MRRALAYESPNKPLRSHLWSKVSLAFRRADCSCIPRDKLGMTAANLASTRRVAMNRILFVLALVLVSSLRRASPSAILSKQNDQSRRRIRRG